MPCTSQNKNHSHHEQVLSTHPPSLSVEHTTVLQFEHPLHFSSPEKYKNHQATLPSSIFSSFEQEQCFSFPLFSRHLLLRLNIVLIHHPMPPLLGEQNQKFLQTTTRSLSSSTFYNSQPADQSTHTPEIPSPVCQHEPARVDILPGQ